MESNASRDKLITDMKIVLADAEDLMKAAASSTGEKAAELRERAMVALRSAKESAQDVQDALMEKSKEAARAADDFVHESPWKAVGIAAAAGFLLGLLVNRK